MDEIWRQLVQKSPALLNPDAVVTFKAANLRKLLEQVYEQGQKSGGKEDILRTMFGM